MPNARPRVAVYAGAFDPPAEHHRQIARRLAEQFDRVVVFPSGPRDDRPSADSLPVHRAVMADLNFAHLDKVTVELDDLERGRFTPNHEFPRLFGAAGEEIWHVVPYSAVDGGAEGQSRIQTEWAFGADLWRTSHFVVLREHGEPTDPAELPPNNVVFEVPPHVTTELIRSHLFDGRPADGLLCPDIAAYIRRHGLFRPTPPSRECTFHLGDPPRLHVVYDHRNPKSVAVADRLRPFEHSDPEVIAVAGGDGTMLRAIRKHWRDRRPFFGINTGHVGFLLNDAEPAEFWKSDLRLHQLPLLWVEMTLEDGSRRAELAFNDCWVERESGQTAWVEISVNGSVRMPKMVSDGMLLATAAGSTSYARAMGATPMPFNAPLLVLAGSNVLKPEFWHPAVLTTDSAVSVRNLDPSKRPLRGFIDGVAQGRVIEMSARVSQIAAVELLFARGHDPVAKLALLQFPQPT